MPLHIDPDDPNCKTAAAEILRRHNEGQPEANITTAVRDFLTITGLVKPEHIVEENPPAQGSRSAVDLTALDTFIEFKRRIGTTGGFNPDPKNVNQLDDYLAQSQKDGRVRMGILTDGTQLMCNLFSQHTCLAAVTGMVAHARLGIRDQTVDSHHPDFSGPQYKVYPPLD